MWEELAKVAVRCAQHGREEKCCEVCRAVAVNRVQLAAIKARRDQLVRQMRELLEAKKVVMVDLR